MRVSSAFSVSSTSSTVYFEYCHSNFASWRALVGSTYAAKSLGNLHNTRSLPNAVKMVYNVPVMLYCFNDHCHDIESVGKVLVVENQETPVYLYLYIGHLSNDTASLQKLYHPSLHTPLARQMNVQHYIYIFSRF